MKFLSPIRAIREQCGKLCGRPEITRRACAIDNSGTIICKKSKIDLLIHKFVRKLFNTT